MTIAAKNTDNRCKECGCAVGHAMWCCYNKPSITRISELPASSMIQMEEEPEVVLTDFGSGIGPAPESVSDREIRKIVDAVAHQTYVDGNPKTAFGLTKVPLHLIPPSAQIFMALGLQDGARPDKYGPFNWRDKGVTLSVYIAALSRHMLRFQDGEDIDPESGKPHLAHALANLAIIVDAISIGNMTDDRPKPGAATKLLKEWEISK